MDSSADSYLSLYSSFTVCTFGAAKSIPECMPNAIGDFFFGRYFTKSFKVESEENNTYSYTIQNLFEHIHIVEREHDWKVTLQDCLSFRM